VSNAELENKSYAYPLIISPSREANEQTVNVVPNITVTKLSRQEKAILRLLLQEGGFRYVRSMWLSWKISRRFNRGTRYWNSHLCRTQFLTNGHCASYSRALKRLCHRGLVETKGGGQSKCVRLTEIGSRIAEEIRIGRWECSKR